MVITPPDVAFGALETAEDRVDAKAVEHSPATMSIAPSTATTGVTDRRRLNAAPLFG
jgi:hypothetical protein